MSLPRLRKSAIRGLDEELPISLSKSDVVQGDDTVLVVNGVFSFFLLEGVWIPALPLLLREDELLPRVVVDMGAVRHVVQGADIMRPGVVSFPDVIPGSIVVVVDETHGKALSVGKMLFSGVEARELSGGKVVQNLHYVGDALWKEYV